MKKNKSAPLTREQFEALPIVQQRKVIAADIVAAIDAGKMKGNIKCGLYSQRARDAYVSQHDADAAVSSAAPCWVCGIGAPMVALARRVDSLSDHIFFASGLYSYVYGARQYLESHFPLDHAILIEVVYEDDERSGELREDNDGVAAGIDLCALSAFRSAHDYGTPRLRAIWKNVLESEDGLFHLPAVT